MGEQSSTRPRVYPHRVTSWRSDVGGIRRLFTSRADGVSLDPYAGRNLGAHVGDDPVAVAENRRRLAGDVDVPPDRLVFMNQVHGADVAVVGDYAVGIPAVDALVTTASGLALVVLVADCVPVLLSSSDGEVIAAAHAGRQGMVKGVVPQTVSAMRALTSAPLKAVVGPSVCGRCYEVPAAMVDEAGAVAPEARTVSWVGTPAIDVAAGVVAQLRDLEVALEWVSGCTREREDLFSHRRSGVTGRFAGVIVRGAS